MMFKPKNNFNYTYEMGEAAEKYLDKFPHAPPLPATWRWEEVWNVMLEAYLKGLNNQVRELEDYLNSVDN